eukprot:TRINITY_DN3357_c0_g2_i3.p1 TRINITY_DN3357_c0_g2~~TRINITY_DN3357_c0_g2_i3.p1  ORF type:complete len:902 (-),score=248.73 TRINITY_DN3357_c0_g2_i3:56-2761(-)
MQEEEIFAVPQNAKFGSAARGSNRFTFRDSFALLDPDVVDMYFQEDAEKPNENSIFGTSITDDDLEALKLDSSMDLDDDFLDLTNSSSQSTSSASPPDSELISFDSASSPTKETSQSPAQDSFAPPTQTESSVGAESRDANSSNPQGAEPRNASQELQQASESFVRPRRRTHYASMISQDDLKSLAAQIDDAEDERQKIKESHAKARDELSAKLELQMAKTIGTDHSVSPRQSPRQSTESTTQPAPTTAAPPASQSTPPTSFAPPQSTTPAAASPQSQQQPIPPARPAGGRDRPQSMMVLPSQTSKPQTQPQPQQQPQQQQQEGWFSRFIGGLRNSSSSNATKPAPSSSSTSSQPSQTQQKTTVAQSNDVSKAAASPGAPKPMTPQQQQALEREQKRTAQYNEYLKMAQGMDFTALKQHKIIYQSGVDFHGRSVVMLIGNIPKDVNWDMLFLFFLSTLDPIVEREYVMVYVHLSESSRPQLAWMRKVYTLFQRKWKKNLKQLFIVYPTFWVKTIFRVFRPFVSNKFWSKLVYVDDPKKLYNYMNPTAVQLPEYAMTDALRAELKRYFGVPLDRLMAHPLNEGLEMPHIVEAACRALDTPRALEQEGIFRLSGTLSRMKELRGQYDRGVLVDLEKEPEVHVIAGLLKMWLRELPDPLIPYFLYDMFIENFDKNDIPGSRLRVANLMISVPLFNLRILDKMLRLLNKISTFSSINKMTTSNLAIVFGPNLLRPEQEQPEFALFHASIIPAIIKFMIESPDEMLGPAIALRTEAAAASAAAQTSFSSAPEKAVAAPMVGPKSPVSPRKDDSAEADDGGLLSMGNRQFGFVRDRTKTMQQRRQIAQSLKTEPLTAEKIAEMQKDEDAAAAAASSSAPSSSSSAQASGGDPLGAASSNDLMQFSSE